MFLFAGVTGGRQFITFTGRQITENVFSYYENDLAGTSHSLPSPIGSVHHQATKPNQTYQIKLTHGLGIVCVLQPDFYERK